MQRPILFSGPMVRAILDGRKTQTRRVLKSVGDMDRVFQMDDGSWHVTDSKGGHMSPVTIPYPVGTELWVREAWRAERRFDKMPMGTKPTGAIVWREADGAPPQGAGFGKLRPSIHMPRWASRITLRVTAVKVERLQDISDEDAFLEGVGAEMEYLDGMPIGYGSAIPNYRDLWNSINGPGSWDANPWVVAYSFERVLPK